MWDTVRIEPDSIEEMDNTNLIYQQDSGGLVSEQQLHAACEAMARVSQSPGMREREDRREILEEILEPNETSSHRNTALHFIYAI